MYIYIVSLMPKRVSVEEVYMTKRSRGVLGVMRCNERIRMKQSRASCAANVLSDGCFRGPRGSWGVPRGHQEVPGAQGISQGSFSIAGFVSWAQLDAFSSLKMIHNINSCNKL